MHHDGDSSVEEILATIKKVIERENRETAAAERRRREEPGAFAQHDRFADPERDEVLDLGSGSAQLVEEPDSPEWVADAADEPGEEGVAEAAPQPEPEAIRAQADKASERPANSLVSESTTDSMRESFAALAMLQAGKPGGEEEVSGESALETMVRDMLRPMLAEWLEENLPQIVEALVRDEIDRIAGKKR